MDKFRSLLKRNTSSFNSASNGSGDSPEADVARGVRLFCESGGPNNTGEEVLHLPVIVDAAESSPGAAREAALVIRKFLGKDNFMRAYVQYNAIMLVRILADNPGPTFTRNIDSKFVSTVKELLRDGRDMSVQQILRETLDTFELQKSQDETLIPLITMWKSEKTKWAKRNGNDISSGIIPQAQGQAGGISAPPFTPGQQAYFPPHQPTRHRGGLPAPHELASRIEEAKTSGKLLTQVVQSTPPHELPQNELVEEFAERCQSASRSVQGYINANNPAPDEDTLLTLIETNDLLSAALSKHQRALLQARKQSTRVPSALPPRGPSPGQPTGPVQSPSSLPTEVSREEPPSVALVGPPPLLGTPKPAPRLENPFDDVHASNRLGEPNGLGVDVENRSQTNVTSYGSRSLPEDDDDDDSPEQPRSYRF